MDHPVYLGILIDVITQINHLRHYRYNKIIDDYKLTTWGGFKLLLNVTSKNINDS